MDTNQISLDDFNKVEVRVGKVINAENVEKSEKLIKLTVDFSTEKRTILTGVRGYGYTPEDFLDKQFLFVLNIPYRTIMGIESQGMILAVDGEDGNPEFISAENLPIGSKVR